MKDLTEHFVSGEQVFDGKLLKVYRDVVRLPDGGQGAREYIRHPGAVAIVALFDDGRVLLERQYRYPQRREFIEIPAGKLEPNEPHLETAKRELLEETGYTARAWRRLGVVHTAIAYTDEAIELFLATDLSPGKARLDAGEFLETLIVPFSEAIAMIRDGRITDVKTVAALLWVDRFSEKGSEQFSGNKSAASQLRENCSDPFSGQAACRIGCFAARALATSACRSWPISFFDVSSVRLPCASNFWDATGIATSGCSTQSMFRNTKHWRRWYWARTPPKAPTEALINATGLPAHALSP